MLTNTQLTGDLFTSPPPLQELTRNYEFLLNFTILGQPYSLKNRQIIRVVRKGNKYIPTVTKSVQAKNFMKRMAEQIPNEYKNLRLGSLDNPLAVIVVIYYESRRPDLDIHAILDTLEDTGIVSNDRYIRENHSYGWIDPGNPRAEVFLFRIPDRYKIPHPLEENTYGSF